MVKSIFIELFDQIIKDIKLFDNNNHFYNILNEKI